MSSFSIEVWRKLLETDMSLPGTSEEVWRKLLEKLAQTALNIYSCSEFCIKLDEYIGNTRDRLLRASSQLDATDYRTGVEFESWSRDELSELGEREYLKLEGTIMIKVLEARTLLKSGRNRPYSVSGHCSSVSVLCSSQS